MNEYGFNQGIARNSSQSAYPNLWRGLVGLWCPSVGIQGQRLVDFSPYRQDATMLNGPTWYPGRRGYALSLDGTNDYATIPSGRINTALPSTICAWINYNTSARMTLFSAGDQGQSVTPWFGVEVNHFEGGANSFGLRYVSGGASTFSNAYSTGLTQGARQHIAMVRTGTSNADMSFYLNGRSLTVTSAFQASAVPANATATPALFARVVSGVPGQLTFSGLADDIRFYNRALSAQEIIRIYSGASPLVPIQPVYGKAPSTFSTKPTFFFSAA